MADSSPLRGLLDRASKLFNLAGDFGRWLEEQNQPQYDYDPTDESVHSALRELRQRFGELVQAVRECAPDFTSQNSCPEVGAVVRALTEWAAKWDAQTDSDQTGHAWTFLPDEWPTLNTFAWNGRKAIEAAQDPSKQRKWDFLNGAANEPHEDHPADTPTPAKRTKRSTERGEGQAKLIAALTKHHKYADGSCLNLEPIGNNELAQLAEVAGSTASVFFGKQFGGHTKYRAVCADTTQLVVALKLLNQEFSPHHLYGAKLPDEDDRNDED